MTLAWVPTFVSNLGPLGFARYAAHRVAKRSTLIRAPYKLNSRYTRFPLWCRPGTSDLTMYGEIICSRAFRCLDGVRDVTLILDCGANVGYSSAYFLSRYPQATVIAIEPDPDNFKLLERNLAPYVGRYQAIHSAVWSQPTGVVLSEDRLGVGNECARTVRPIRPGEAPAMHTLDIGTILERSGFERISILKMDIEGAERIVFETNYERWLSRVDNMVIDLEDAECERVFEKAIAGQGFEVSTCDHQRVCLRRDAVADSANC
jgi:FkbM family methyltransferase